MAGKTTSAVIDIRDVRVEEQLKAFEGKIEYGSQLQTDGISSFTLDVTLPRNALIHSYDVVVQAQIASATAVEKVAQVRATEAAASDLAKEGMSVVLDFGTLRTVSGVLAPVDLGIVRVYPWLGTAFARNPIFTVKKDVATETAILPSEVRTERLQVEILGVKSGAELASEMSVLLPEAPSDLEVRIDGGAPVVSFPGPAQPGPDTDLSDLDWNKDGERIVHLADALNKLTGDSTSSDNVTFKVVLSSRVPGKLRMTVSGSPSFSRIRKVKFGAETAKELSFSEEGEQQVALAGLPPDSSIEAIRFTAAGAFPAERVIPPVGPDDASLVDLLIDSERVVCVKLPPAAGLAELTGARLPLSVGSGGAEMRVVLWNNKDESFEPVDVMTDGLSDPVTLTGESEAETWTTFSFKRPVPIESQNLPWMALSVSRGSVSWGLGASKGGSDPLNESVIRRGAPTGPWKPLPQAFQVGAGLSALRGRIRLIGHAPKDSPLAPLVVSLGSNVNTREVTPTAKGTAAELVFSSPLPVSSSVLKVISRISGNVTLRDLEVVSTT
ncbi:MAG TPA: hypothetical protein VF290_20890 [Pyrinomonadaceae bacterium]